MYNVLVIFHHCSQNNGGVRSMLDLMDSLMLKKDIRLFALFPGKTGTAQNYLLNKGIKCRFVPFLRWDFDMKKSGFHKAWEFHKLLNLPFNYYLAKRLNFFIKHYKIDVIYTNTVTVNFGCILSRMYNIPHIWHFREFGWEDHQLKCIYGENLAHKWMQKYSDKIIVISKSLFNKYSLFIPNDKIEIVYDDVSKDYYQKKNKRQFLKKEINILIAGTLQAGKGQKDAIGATKLLVDKGYKVKLYIAGNGRREYFNELKNLIKVNNLENYVILLGQINDMNSLRKKMQIALVCSKYEAFGRVTVEAMLSGMLVIGANVAGTAELIRNMKSGLLYESGNIRSLSSKIEYALENRREMERMATRGQINAFEKFTVGRCCNSVYSIIKHLEDNDNL